MVPEEQHPTLKVNLWYPNMILMHTHVQAPSYMCANTHTYKLTLRDRPEESWRRVVAVISTLSIQSTHFCVCFVLSASGKHPFEFCELEYISIKQLSKYLLNY